MRVRASVVTVSTMIDYLLIYKYLNCSIVSHVRINMARFYLGVRHTIKREISVSLVSN